MTEGHFALLGALIGAVAGIAGGWFAAIASVRASQLSARAPLALIIHQLGKRLISLRVALNTPDHARAIRDFEEEWNNLVVHQRILCPSDRIDRLLDLVRSASKQIEQEPDSVLNLSGQVLDKVSRMIGFHSNRLFRWRAGSDESAILENWLASKDSDILSPELRDRLRTIAK